ncbi:MAG TPA: pectate lyase [Hyphomonadaceae bacterium]|jgi:hypothetical protein|nr:pectate lyase [Hyphomonadaceae bacterium]
MWRRTFLLSSAALALGASAGAQQPALLRTGQHFPGGRGGKIIRVTTLAPSGPGSISEAIKAKGARIIVFEVGGVIDLNRQSLRITSGDLTIAGHTAPAPGITLIRGGIEISQGAQNVVIRHLMVRPGEAGQAKKSGWECDGIYAYGASRIEVSNCSITWATDEGLSASGKRFGKDDKEATLEQWRAFTSHDIVFDSNIVAEGLSNSTHSKGEHSKGTLIHDNVRFATVTRSLYAHNMERNILFKGGTHGFMIDNVVYNPGKRFAHYNLHANEWGTHEYVEGEINITGNAFLAGPSTDKKAAAFMMGGEGALALRMSNNLALDGQGKPLARIGRFGDSEAILLDISEKTDAAAARADFLPMIDKVLAGCGARPWDRDPIDARIIADVKNGTGRIVNSEQEAGGYPVRAETHAPFKDAEWNLETMERR